MKSVINTIMDRSKQPTPEVGMGATYTLATDRHAFTVVGILSPKKIVVQRDKITKYAGFYSESESETEPDPEGTKVILTLRSDGSWKEKGTTNIFNLGYRSEYRDPTF